MIILAIGTIVLVGHGGLRTRKILQLDCLVQEVQFYLDIWMGYLSIHVATISVPTEGFFLHLSLCHHFGG